MLAASDRRVLLDIAMEAARSAARFVRERAVGIADIEWRTKQTADFVSEVDTGAEERIRAVVARRMPEATLIGEELSPDAIGSAARMGVAVVADPLDGTTNFLHGYPWYAVSIGVLVDGALEAGVVINVPTRETYVATRGGGAFRLVDGQADEPLAVSRIEDPSRALIGTGFPFKNLDVLDRYQRQFAAVTRHTAGLRRAGAAALDLCDVARGRFEGFWELTLAPWDIAAGLLIIREAGGLATDLAGHDAPVAHGPLVAGNPAMHRWLLEHLRD